MFTPLRCAFLLVTLLGASFGLAGTAASTRISVHIHPTVHHGISRFIYGLNFAEAKSLWGDDVPRGITFSRMGSNRMSACNWETNASQLRK